MCLVGAYINTYFAVIFDMDATSIARYISPFVEEIMKMIPIVLFVLLREEHKDEVIQFAVAIGAGFATFENCCYLIQNGAENIGFILIRGMAVGIMHIVCALILGIGLNLIGKYKGTMIPGTVENSWKMLSILIAVTAAPVKEESRTRRRELPSVVPYPRSSGEMTYLP